MIIKRIKANNLLKYSRLDITLPETGLIAISGQNESGKSSIGEAVCFALFGRTFSITTRDIQKVLRWGENHCDVMLEFKLEDEIYQVSRLLDREGNQSAKLTRLDAEDPIARGSTEVTAILTDMLGYDYEQFVESFYLAQREITTPHPHSQAVKIMAGIEPLEWAMQAIEQEKSERQTLLKDIQDESIAIEIDIERLGIQPGHFESLEQEHAENDQQQSQLAQLIDDTQKSAYTYSQNEHQIQRQQSRRSVFALMRFMLAVVALATGVLWLLFTQGGQLPLARSIDAFLVGQMPFWRNMPVHLLAYIAGACAVLLLLFWLQIRKINGKINQLKTESGKLIDYLIRARDIDVEIAEYNADGSQVDPNIDTDTQAVQNETPPRPDKETFDQLKRPIAAGEASAAEVMAYIEPEISWLQYILQLLQTESEHLQNDLEDERKLLAKQQELQSILDNLQTKANHLRGRISLLDTSLELLRGASNHLSNTFNRDIKNLVARTLPLFTDGRYEHLQIGNDLAVRVFSSEKRDFMDLEEVSSGTQRQIMLALRLALSQKLLARTIKGNQFTFLDEPFAFFDEERTRKALIALANLGEKVSQVWIVTQEFPQQDEVSFAVNIVCERGKDQLLVPPKAKKKKVKQ